LPALLRRADLQAAPEQTRGGDEAFVISLFGKRFEDKGGTEFSNSGCIGTIGLTLWVRE
jgi:hypothetical protein